MSGSLLCDDDDEIQCGGDYTIVYIYIYIFRFFFLNWFNGELCVSE